MSLLSLILLSILHYAQAQYGYSYCVSTTPAKDFACSNYVNNGGIDKSRCFFGTCQQCMDGGGCSDTGYAPQCGHNLNYGCYMTEEKGPYQLWSNGFGDYYYQYWHCNELCNEYRLCSECEPGSIRVGCGDTSEGICEQCTRCGPGTFVMYDCFISYGVIYNTFCNSCEPGTFSTDEHNAFCTSCPAGTYSDSGASSCTKCEVGTYQSPDVQSYCPSCDEGTYQANTGATGCLPCESCLAGYYRTGCGGASAGTCTICTNVI